MGYEMGWKGGGKYQIDHRVMIRMGHADYGREGESRVYAFRIFRKRGLVCPVSSGHSRVEAEDRQADGQTGPCARRRVES